MKCLSELKGLVQSAVANIDASVKATLNVSTAKDKVTFFLRQFRQAKSAFDEAEVRQSHNLHSALLRCCTSEVKNY